MKAKKIALVGADCVSCGACMRACPIRAMVIDRGVMARVAQERCVGCGKCVPACPAGLITILMRGGEESHEKAVV